MNNLSPKERVFQMLASIAAIVRDSNDLNAEREHIATLVDHCRSWETQVVDVELAANQVGVARHAIVDEGDMAGEMGGVNHV